MKKKLCYRDLVDKSVDVNRTYFSASSERSSVLFTLKQNNVRIIHISKFKTVKCAMYIYVCYTLLTGRLVATLR